MNRLVRRTILATCLMGPILPLSAIYASEGTPALALDPQRDLIWLYLGLAGLLLLSLIAGVLLLHRFNRRLAEQEIRHERDLFAGGPVSVFIWLPRPGWPVAYVSRNIVDVMGYTAEEMMAAGFLFADLIHPDDRGRIEREVAEYLASGTRQFEQSYRLRCKTGEYRWFYDFSMPERNEAGKLVRVRAYLFDQSEIKQTEAALIRSNTDLERFAYSVSHDMRQPLRMVTGHLQLLERGLKDQLDDDNRANLNFAIDGARRMDEMIVSLLDYSRVGRKTGSKRWMESRESLDEALDFLAPAIDETNATIAVGGEWPKIFASRDEMTRLFQNLLGNAVKYHEADRPPRVEVEAKLTADRWRVNITDHGIGIATRQIDRLFQFFSRLQPRARFEGCGMGLALCRRIVEHHGGRIWAESSGEGQGSSFIFEIPLPLKSAKSDSGSSAADNEFNEYPAGGQHDA